VLSVLAAHPVAATRILMFDSTPLGTYSVTRGQTRLADAAASAAGAVRVVDSATPGTQYTLRYLGVTPVAPGQVANFSAAGDDRGCARLQWDAPPAGDFVDSYRVYARSSVGAWTDSVDVAAYLVGTAGSATWFVACGYTAGTWTFALRAHNQFGLFSPISSSASTSITTGNASGPAPPTALSASEPTFGCAQLTWKAPGDPSVAGYRMYLGASSGAYTDFVDAGTATTAQICGLAAGKWYLSARSYDGAAMLSAYAPGVSITLVGVDVSPPVISDMQPANGSTSVARNTSVSFRAIDSATGVDTSSVSVTFNGVAAGSLMFSGTASNTVVQAMPVQPFAAQTAVAVQVDISDRAGPANSARASWTFTTGDSAMADTQAPVIAWISPAPDTKIAAGVDLVAEVSDAGMGVDLSTLRFALNGSSVVARQSGPPNRVRITYSVPAAYPPGRLAVRVSACDLAGNCAIDKAVAFTVQGAATVAMGQGVIVPDGYWAGAPDRPLEIRNLPARWSVYIFDTAGSLVRRFRNSTASSRDWVWDFSNDAGRRVVRALYMIRVVDAGGGVRRSGRFVVQHGR